MKVKKYKVTATAIIVTGMFYGLLVLFIAMELTGIVMVISGYYNHVFLGILVFVFGATIIARSYNWVGTSLIDGTFHDTFFPSKKEKAKASMHQYIGRGLGK